MLPLDGFQGHLPASDIRIAGDGLTTFPGRRGCRSLLSRDATREMLFQDSLHSRRDCALGEDPPEAEHGVWVSIAVSPCGLSRRHELANQQTGPRFCLEAALIR